MNNFKRLWRNEWLRAFLLAVGLLVVLHLFVFRFVSVQSTSMFATLRPGDLLLVQRWPKWTGLERGDIAVFRDPLEDRMVQPARTLMVKRVAGAPSDRVELRRGVLVVNGRPVPDAPGTTQSYLVRLRTNANVHDFFERYGIPIELLRPGQVDQELPLNKALAERMETDSTVVHVSPMSLSIGSPRHVFPFSPRYPWNGDNYGPIDVPRKGDTLRITVDNFPLYDRIMSVYEGHVLSVQGEAMLVDGRPLNDYVMEQDYYFVLGDSRHFSADSRYWGFLPASHVVGRGVLLLGGDRP